MKGVQIQGKAQKLTETEYPDVVVSAIEALNPPMPPYAVFKIEPLRFYVPKIEEGINKRVEVSVT